MNQKMAIFSIIPGKPTRVFDFAQIKSDAGGRGPMAMRFRVAIDSAVELRANSSFHAHSPIAAVRYRFYNGMVIGFPGDLCSLRNERGSRNSAWTVNEFDMQEVDHETQ
jgi:hypothetical protein